MKKVNFKLMTVLMSALILAFVVSCKKDDPVEPEPPGDGKPVLGTDFNFTVTGNNVLFTTTLTSYVAFKDQTSGVVYPAEAGEKNVFIAKKGTYPFTCVAVIDGAEVASDPFNVVIDQDDLSFLEEEPWKSLTGGTPGYNKKWRLDDFTSPGNVNFCKYFNGSIGFVDPSNGLTNGILKTNAQWGSYANDYPEWFDGVQDLPEDATISFDGATGTAKLVMTKGITRASGSPEYWSETVEGGFTLEIVDTADYDEISIPSVASQSGGTYGAYAASVSFEAPVRFPLDMGVMVDDRFDLNVLQTGFDIVSVTDSSMVVFAWRQREWGNDSKWGHLFFFIVDDYTYTYDDPDEFVPPTRPVKADATVEVGTYKLADVPGFWVGWDPVESKNGAWTETGDKDQFLLDMVGWWVFGDPSLYITDDVLNAEGQVVVDSAYSRYSAQTIEFTATDAIINYKGYDGVDSTYNTTYTAANGVITFADSVSIYAAAASFNKVKEVYFLDNQFTSEGIILGIDNVDEGTRKYESTVLNLIKQ